MRPELQCPFQAGADRQAAKAQIDAVVPAFSAYVEALRIRSAVNDALSHVFQNPVTIDDISRKAYKSAQNREPFIQIRIYCITKRRRNKVYFVNYPPKTKISELPRRVSLSDS